MNDGQLFEYRKANRLCVVCGEDAADGLTKCWRCYQIEVVRARAKYEGTTKQEFKKKRCANG